MKGVYLKGVISLKRVHNLERNVSYKFLIYFRTFEHQSVWQFTIMFLSKAGRII